MFRQDFTCPALLFASLVSQVRFRIRGYHPLSPDFPDCFANSNAKNCKAAPISLATTLGISVDFFSCSYLDVSVRRVRFAYLCIQYAMTLAGRVSSFGHLRIKARLPAPRSLSQATASFIACNRQGIHHVHLVACPYNVDLWDIAIPKTLSKHAVCPTVDACLIRYNHNPATLVNLLYHPN